MFYKGIILEIKENYCLVLCDDGRVVRVRRKHDINQGDKIFFLEEDLYIEEEKSQDIVLPFKSKEGNYKISRLSVKKILAVAAAIIICFSTINVVNYENQAYAAVSMDGNESIQLEINRRGKIVKIISYGNEISQEELDVYKGMSIDKIWGIITEDEDDKSIYTIGFAALKGGKETEDKVASYLKQLTKGSHVLYIQCEKQDVYEAEKEKMSLGAYISSEFPDEDEFEDFVEHSSRESLEKYIEKNKDKITPEMAEDLMQAKDDYDDDIDDEDYYEDSDEDSDEDDIDDDDNDGDDEHESDDDD